MVMVMGERKIDTRMMVMKVVTLMTMMVMVIIASKFANSFLIFNLMV